MASTPPTSALRSIASIGGSAGRPHDEHDHPGQGLAGETAPSVVGPRSPWWTPSDSIPTEMEWAVIVAEDANFYRHEGIDVKAIKEAIKYDLQKKRLARGASTITQQTAKNLFLSREKSVTRKNRGVLPGQAYGAAAYQGAHP